MARLRVAFAQAVDMTVWRGASGSVWLLMACGGLAVAVTVIGTIIEQGTKLQKRFFIWGRLLF